MQTKRYTAKSHAFVTKHIARKWTSLDRDRQFPSACWGAHVQAPERAAIAVCEIGHSTRSWQRSQSAIIGEADHRGQRHQQDRHRQPTFTNELALPGSTTIYLKPYPQRRDSDQLVRSLFSISRNSCGRCDKDHSQSCPLPTYWQASTWRVRR